MLNFRKTGLSAAICAAMATAACLGSVEVSASEIDTPGVRETPSTARVQSRRHASRRYRSHDGCLRRRIKVDANGCFGEDVAFSYYAPRYDAGYWDAGFNPLGALFQTLVGVPSGPLPAASIYPDPYGR
jgi:hypothetical protein